jgi:hypothetical protein
MVCRNSVEVIPRQDGCITLQDDSHNTLRLIPRNCNYNTKSSTDIAQNNEYKTVMHKTEYSGVRWIVRQIRGRVVDCGNQEV